MLSRSIAVAMAAVLFLTSCAQKQYDQFQSQHESYWAGLVQGLKRLETGFDKECGSLDKAGRKQLYQVVSCRNAKTQAYLESKQFPYVDLSREYLFDTANLALSYEDGELNRSEFQKELQNRQTVFASQIQGRNAEALRLEQEKRDEQVTAENVGKVALAILAIVAIAAAASHGGGGGGYSSPYTSDHRGCCSWHGGISHCSGGLLVCNDGRYSPTCGC